MKKIDFKKLALLGMVAGAVASNASVEAVNDFSQSNDVSRLYAAGCPHPSYNQKGRGGYVADADQQSNDQMMNQNSNRSWNANDPMMNYPTSNPNNNPNGNGANGSNSNNMGRQDPNKMNGSSNGQTKSNGSSGY